MTKLPTWAYVTIVGIGCFELLAAVIGYAVVNAAIPWTNVVLGAAAVGVFGPTLYARVRDWRSGGGRTDWPAVFWPRTTSANPNALVWIGRIQHWLAVALAATVGMLFSIIGLFSGRGLFALALGFLAFVILAMAGRGARYLLSKE